jgi:Putative restriction endonuclease
MMTGTVTADPISELPEIDQRLVTPETRFEIVDGRSIYVAPADEPHGERHIGVGGLVLTHCAAGYSVAGDMLTRTSRIDDIAPDVSVYPTARDPRTGGRQLEELAFEIVSTESLTHAGTKARKLVARGVRRVFAVDLERVRVLEWTQAQGRWSALERGSRITDPALAVPLPVDALLDAALTKDTMVRAFRQQRHPEFLAEHAEGEAAGEAKGLARALLIMLASRGLDLTDGERHRILEERDLGRLERWLATAGTCADLAALLTLP